MLDDESAINQHDIKNNEKKVKIISIFFVFCDIYL